MLLTEGNLNSVNRVFSYPNAFPKGRIIDDTSYPDHSMFPIQCHKNWKGFYPDAEEELPSNLFTSKEPNVKISV
jgi:hypothetical protein